MVKFWLWSLLTPKSTSWNTAQIQNGHVLSATASFLAKRLQTATNLLRQIPIGAVQALLAVDALDKNPVAHFFLHAPVLDSLITAILPSAALTHLRCLCSCMLACAESALPGLALRIIHSPAEGVATRAHAPAAGLVLRIFLALLPWLLAIMGRVQGLYSQSMLDFSVVTKYYVFQARAQPGAVGCDWAPVPRAWRISSLFYFYAASLSAANLHKSQIVYSGCGPFLNRMNPLLKN